MSESVLYADVQSLRNMLAQSRSDYEQRLDPTDRARGYHNALNAVIEQLEQILHEHSVAQTPPGSLEKRATRSAVAWYVQYMEHERDGASASK